MHKSLKQECWVFSLFYRSWNCDREQKVTTQIHARERSGLIPFLLYILFKNSLMTNKKYQLVKNPPIMQETPVWFPGQEEPWRKDRLPTPLFLEFPGASAGKESTCNAGGLGSVPGLGRSPGEGQGYSLHYSGGRIILHYPWGFKELDTTEQLSLTHMTIWESLPSFCVKSTSEHG